jgi:pyrroloquinoline quinone biosynthesis protein D
MVGIAKLDGNFTETAIDDEVIIMRLENGELFSLAGTGAAVWRLIDGTRDRGALVAALSDEFDADQAEIAGDVDQLLEQLAESGLIAAG